MRYILICIFITLCSLGFSQEQKTDFWENGQKVREGILKDSLREGKWTWWYKNGRLWKEGNYTKGVKTGKWVAFFDDSTKQSEEYFENGTNVFWYANGQKKKTK